MIWLKSLRIQRAFTVTIDDYIILHKSGSDCTKDEREKKATPIATELRMSSLPPALNFPETEEGICKKWKEEDSFRQQNKLSEERGDDVSFFI